MADPRIHDLYRDLVSKRLEQEGLNRKKVRYELRTLDGYADLSDYENGSLDFAVVDGVIRATCVESVLPKLKPGGYLYLDNSDKDMTIPGGDLRIAEDRVREAARVRGGNLEYFTGLTIGTINTHQGLLAKL